jgi:hypothetical protein
MITRNNNIMITMSKKAEKKEQDVEGEHEQ